MSDEPLSAPPQGWPTFEDPTLLDKVIDIIAREGAVERDRIVPTATLDSLGLASLDVVTILMGVEEELDIYIPMSSELSDARNLAEFVGTIAKAKAQGSPKATDPA